LAQAIASGWTGGAVTRDASGFPILVPSSRGNLNPLLFRPTYDSRVAAQPLFLNKDPNCQSIDPMQAFILNPKAWAEFAAATPVFNAQGNVFSGFGAILMGNRDMGENLRTGQLIARITF
jgi:hypothetical protein